MARVQSAVAVQAAASARSTAAGIADPANTAIALTAPFSGTDVTADFAADVARAALELGQAEVVKAESRAAEAVRAAEAAEAAAKLANAQVAPAFKAAAAAARSSSDTARSSVAAMRSAADAAEDGAKARAAAASADKADVQARADAKAAREAADQAFADAAAARTAATRAEAEAVRARTAATEAENHATAAASAASLAEREATAAQTAAAQAEKDAADAAQLATSAEEYATSAEAAAKKADSYAKEADAAAERAEAYQREQERKAREEAASKPAPTTPESDPDLVKQALEEAGISAEEYEAALAIAGKDLLDYLLENGAEILVELVAGDIMECIDDPDIATCIWAIISNLPVLKAAKLLGKIPKITKAILGISAFLDKTAAARKKVKKVEEALEKVKKGAKCLTDDKPGKGGKSVSAAGRPEAAANHAGGTWARSTAADDDPSVECGPYIWWPYRPGVDHTDQGPVPADAGIPAGAFLRPGDYIFVVRLDGTLRAMSNDDLDEIEDYPGHTSLAEDKPVLMAGEFEVGAAGLITMVRNFSGHYMPQQKEGFTSLKDITKASFLGHGWVFPDKAWKLYVKKNP